MAAKLDIPEPKLTLTEATALAACVDMKATPEQAKVAIDWIMREACQFLRPLPMVGGGIDGQRAVDFAIGRQYPAHLIRHALSPEGQKQARGNSQSIPPDVLEARTK